MSYEEAKQEPGRRPVYILEIYPDRCSRTYGVAPCTAAVGVTGTQKCFNTYGDGAGDGQTSGGCQDVANFEALNTFPIRFASERIDGLQQPGEPPVFPILGTLDTSPTILTPGRGLGIRSSVTATFMNIPYNDQVIDPYVDERTYDVLGQGTLMGRLFARHRYLEGRRADVLTGYLDENGEYDAANFVRRTYVIYEVKLPKSSGQGSFILKDPLKKADIDRAQYPELSEGALAVDFAIGATVMQLEPGQAAAYAGVEFVRINEEVMEVTNVDAGLDQITVNRATLPAFYPSGVMVESDHDTEDLVQACKLYDGVRVDDVVYDLLVNGASFDTNFLPPITLPNTAPDDWTLIADEWFPNFICKTLITEPTGVKDLLIEITEHIVLLWWDEREQVVKFDAMKPIANNALPVFNDQEHLISDSVSGDYDVKLRNSRTIVYFGQKNPVEDLDEKKNFKNGDGDIDLETEQLYKSKKIREIFSRWLPSTNRPFASEVASRLNAEYKHTKIIAAARLDPKDDKVWTGDQIFINSQYIESEFGNPDDYKGIIIRVKEMLTNGTVQYAYTIQQMANRGRCMVVAPNDDPNNPGNPYPDYVPAKATDESLLFYGYVCGNDGRMSDGDPPYTVC